MLALNRVAGCAIKQCPPLAHWHPHSVIKTLPQCFVLLIERKRDKKRESKTL